MGRDVTVTASARQTQALETQQAWEARQQQLKVERLERAQAKQKEGGAGGVVDNATTGRGGLQ